MSMPPPRVARATSLAVAALAAACSGSSPSRSLDAAPVCREIGCAPSLRVRFSRPSWPAGDYRIEVTSDGMAGTCDVKVPLACQVPTICEGTVDFSPDLAGCQLDPSVQSLAGISFTYSTPASVTVRVRQGDRELGSGTFTPTYTESRPNGPGCEPVCHTALNESLTLPL